MRKRRLVKSSCLECGVEFDGRTEKANKFCGHSCTIKNTRRRGALSSTIHGMHNTPEYRAWQAMNQRCYNHKNWKFQDYGGRGITVFDPWRGSFEAFFAVVGLKPSPRHTIERIDNNGNYEPGNVRWATRLEQQRNRRTVKIIEHNGVRGCVSEVAESFGFSPHLIRVRLLNGWSIERAMSTPVDKRFSR